MSIREEQCNKVCRTLDDVLANRPTERDSLIIAVRKAFESLEQFGNSEQLPSAQPTQTNAPNALKSLDCISRQAAIDAVESVDWYHQNKNGEMVHGANDDVHQAWYKAEDIYKAIKSVPPAQPVNIAKLQPNCNQVASDCASDCISKTAAIDIVEFECGEWRGLAKTIAEEIEQLPPAQPERTCVNCGRTANNGGWYADGGTRCPIEEHYALPKDGFCHLWEKRNVTDDDYPERREE